MYHIEVSEASSTSLEKRCFGFPEQVTEAYPFLIPKNPEFLAIPPKIPEPNIVSGPDF